MARIEEELLELRLAVDRVADAQRAQPTLRDQFAMAALTGMFAGRPPGELPAEDWAAAAYAWADAMIEARKPEGYAANVDRVNKAWRRAKEDK